VSTIIPTTYNVYTDTTSTSTTGGVWYHVDPNLIYTSPPDPYGSFRYAIRQYFVDAGITLFPEEEALICFYVSRRKDPDALNKECDEWFPIIARKRIVE